LRDEQLLRHIQNTALKNKCNIASLIKHCKDQRMIDLLNHQFLQYNSLVSESSDKLVSCGIAPKNKGPSPLIKTLLLFDRKKKASACARTMVRQISLDLLKSNQNIQKYTGATTDILNLALSLKQIEENTIQSLKPFL